MHIMRQYYRLQLEYGRIQTAMKVLVLYKERSEHRQAVEEFMRQFKQAHPEIKLETMDIDNRLGYATANLYDVMRFPSVLALRNDGTALQTWEGEENIPQLDEVAAYVFDQS